MHLQRLNGCTKETLLANDNASYPANRKGDKLGLDENIPSTEPSNNLLADASEDASNDESSLPQQRLEELLERTRIQLRVVNALSRNFLNVFLADLTTETLSILKLEGYVTSGLREGFGLSYSYRTILANYTEERVHPEDRDMFVAAIDPKRVAAELENTDEYTGHYRILVDGNVHYFQFRFTLLYDEEAGKRLNQVVEIPALLKTLESAFQ